MFKLEGVNSILFVWARSRLNYIQRLNYSEAKNKREKEGVLRCTWWGSDEPSCVSVKSCEMKRQQASDEGEPVAAIGRIQERDKKGKLNRCQRRDNITQYPPSYSCILMQATSLASPHLKLCVLLWLGSTCFILSLFYTEFSFLQLLILPFTFSGWSQKQKEKEKKTAQLYHASIINAETDLVSDVQHLHSNY